jgi:hypothetical protein
MPAESHLSGARIVRRFVLLSTEPPNGERQRLEPQAKRPLHAVLAGSWTLSYSANLRFIALINEVYFGSDTSHWAITFRLIISFASRYVCFTESKISPFLLLLCCS